MSNSEICRLFTANSFNNSNSRPRSYSSATSSVVYSAISAVHSIDSFSTNSTELSTLVFSSHSSHISVILAWLACIAFHVGWSGNYNLWVVNPVSLLSASHPLLDPHLGFSGSASSLGLATVSHSGCYYWCLVSGITSSIDLFYVSLSF
jgi:hypothetical protein